MNIYGDGEYLQNNPTWHMEDSPFKARHIHKMIVANKLKFHRIAEIGCGAGGVIRELSQKIAQPDVSYTGFDISHDAIQMAKQTEQTNLRFEEADLLQSEEVFDLLLVIDVFEHVPDYLGFIERCRPRATFKIFHIPLDIHLSSVFRGRVASAREKVGHLHYFTSETALATIRDTGHQILDHAFTPTAIELYREHPSAKRAIANIPRWIVSRLSEKLAARWFGGYSLLVLAK
jgi:cyclopropane fatty-acyl-phospholipid synthase-like methyltransferase